MDSTETVDWKENARLLRGQGKSEREIAMAVGKSASSVHEAVKDVAVPGDDPVLGGEDAGEFAAGEVMDPDPEPSNGHHRGPINIPASLAAIAGDSSGATPGQLDIDGGETQEPPVHVEEIRVDGTTQLSLVPSLGGKKPQSATITLRGGAYELLDGKALQKGDVVHFEGTAVVREVAQRDKPDSKTGVVVTCKQTHVAQITDLQVK